MVTMATAPAQIRLSMAKSRIYHAREDLLKHLNTLPACDTLHASIPHAADEASIMPAILHQLLILLQAEGAAFATIDTERDEMVIECACGAWDEMSSYRQQCSSVVGASNFRSISSHLTIACVPLMIHGNRMGALCVGRQHSITEDDMRILRAMGTIAANALSEQQRINQERQHTYDATLEGWVRALELRDNETEEHTRRVTETTVRLANSLGISGEELLHLRRGALLHDIGKIAIPDSILLKPGPLSEEEWHIMRQHPLHAYELLAPIAFLRPALHIPLSHHERWDGSGYPYGLKGDQIPLAARIFAVVDVWDSLRFDRPYRKGWPEERVLNYIAAQAGTHFDPAIVQHFLRYLQNMHQVEIIPVSKLPYQHHEQPNRPVLSLRTHIATGRSLLSRLLPRVVV